jgi:hypothetical protein
MKSPKMKRRGKYPGITDQAVVQALIDVESNAIEALDQVALWARPAWNVVGVSRDYQAQLWDMVVCSDSCTLLFPPSSAANKGAEICVVKIGSLTVTVRPISGTVNGTATDAGSAASYARIYESSGEGWHTVA